MRYKRFALCDETQLDMIGMIFYDFHHFLA